MSEIYSIVVVDVQEGFMNSSTNGLPSKIKAFLDSANLRHRIFTRFINPGPQGPFSQILGWDRLSKPDEFAVVSSLTQYATHVIDKKSYSPFQETNFAEYLKDHDIRETYVCGIDTDVCVMVTAVDLFSRNIRPVVLKDLSMSHAGKPYHQAALEIMPRLVGRDNVTTSNAASKVLASA